MKADLMSQSKKEKEKLEKESHNLLQNRSCQHNKGNIKGEAITGLGTMYRRDLIRV